MKKRLANKAAVEAMSNINVVQNAKMASTKLLQLRTEVHRIKHRLVTIRCLDEYSPTCPYDIIAVGAATTHALVAVGAPLVAAYWPSATAEDWSLADKYTFLIASPEPDMTIPQAINMNDFHERYPHLGEWSGSSDDATSKIAALLRYDSVATAADPRPNFHVLVQLWKPSSNRRWRELCAALKRNAECPFVDKVHVLLESSAAAEAWARWPPHLKAKIVASDCAERLTYRRARDYLAGLPEGDFAALANTDIFFDESIRELWSMDLTGKCLALLRYEVSLGYAERAEGASEPAIFGPRDDSQDCWIFRVADLRGAADWGPLTFTLGQAGCDNAFAGELVRRRWTVANPCMSIKTMHVHESGLRTYRADDRVSQGVYATVAPCGLLESTLLSESKFAVAATLTARAVETFKVEPWTGGLAGHGAYQRGLTTLYKSVQPTRIGPEVKWKDCTLKVLRSGEAVVTDDGLIAIGNGIGFGSDKAAGELSWGSTEYNTLTPLVEVDRAFFLPFASGCVGDDMLQLGRALWLSDVVGTVTLPCAADRLMMSLQNTIPLKNIQGKALLCKEAFGFLPSLTLGSIVEPAIKALRSTISVRSADEASWVVFSGDGELVNSLYEITNEELPITHISNPNVPPSRILYPMSNAKVIVGCGSAGGYMWAAPAGATYIDLEPTQASLNMANVCGLKYIPLGFDSGMLAEDKARILLDAGNWSVAAAAAEDRPVLYMPAAQEGYHGHPGDSFRELADLWAEAGYVERRYHNGVFCWLNEVGKTLLYDRDTHEWLGKAPESETKWSNAVFANEVKEGEVPWIYWARRPRLLVGRQPLAERKRDLVFYGKIENSTQFKRRAAKATGKDWSTVCDEFEMPVGGKYKYSQAEYLDRLAEARFGLCLPGFGPKCHREVECMALGTVPIITPGIDTEGYAEPLVAGVHFLAAETPEEAQRLVKETPADAWAAMSAAGRAWYERNASVLGSWITTKKQLGY